ncbi:MAG TPA: hypothetical protein VGW78_04280 [Candidatus Babeliales bacterium]|jgi:hypothetical protein|nr:hypothetical protein [Candidatus Babeliales bacterium]
MNKKIVGVILFIGLCAAYKFDIMAQCRCSLIQETQEVTGCPCISGATECACIQKEPEPEVEVSSSAISQDEAVTTLLGIVCVLKKQIEADKEELQSLEREYNEARIAERRRDREYQQKYGYTQEPVSKSYYIQQAWEKQNQLIKQKEKERAAIEYALARCITKSYKNKEVV